MNILFGLFGWLSERQHMREFVITLRFGLIQSKSIGGRIMITCCMPFAILPKTARYGWAIISVDKTYENLVMNENKLVKFSPDRN